jgi:4-hydroxymandelate oxidase
VFIASPPVGPLARRDLHLVRAVRRAFPGPAEFLGDPGHRAQIAAYMADLARTGGREVSVDLLGEPPAPELGHSYSEMAEALIGSAVRADEPVDLLILAFSVHDMRPGQQTAAYLSHVTPGAPMAFAVCDQGSAAAFSGLRIAREYASWAGVRRALLIVVEQGALPYRCPVPLPSRHQGAALLFGDCATPRAQVVGVRQHPGVPPDGVAAVATADLADLTAGRSDVTLVLGDSLAGIWTGPAAARTRVGPTLQPSTGVWWGLVDELTGEPGLLVAADYDADLRYLCLAAFETRATG